MAQSIEQITQSIRALEEQANQLGEKLYEAYQGYRGAVGQTALQQLIMACFTLCTEAYPEEFLTLEVYQRNQLQAKIRKAAKQLQADLIEKLPHPQAEVIEPSVLESPLNQSLGAQLLSGAQLSGAQFSDTQFSGAQFPDAQFLNNPLSDEQLFRDEASEMINSDDDTQDSIEAEVNSIEQELRALLSLESLMPASVKAKKNKTPIDKLMQWQDSVEETTNSLMRQTSRDLNLSFQKAGLIPAQIPAPILEAAAHNDGGDPFGKTPHLLRMVLEAREVHRDNSDRKGGEDNAAKRRRREEKRSSARPPTIVPIVAVQLRLVELEFNDTHLISWRNQIRELSKQLKSLAKDYQKKQREQAIANARLAWQSTWTND